MIICKDKGLQTLTIVKNNSTAYVGGYSMIVQNTVSKEITVYNVFDKGNELYHKFDVDVQLNDGEYVVLLFENPEHLPFYPNINNIKTINYVKFITTEGDLITSGKFCICYGMGEQELHWLSSDVLRMGEYKTPNHQYNKGNQSYITYNK